MEKLVHAAQQLFGVHLTGRQVVALMTFENELLAWNEKFNLTAIRDVEGIRTKHFLDSFSCILAWKENPPRRLIDVGTGAGFPGIPLKILYPSMELTLVESVGKKANFCRHMVEILKLEAVEVMTARAEEVGQMPAQREVLRLGGGTRRGKPASPGRISPAAGAGRREDAGPERVTADRRRRTMLKMRSDCSADGCDSLLPVTLPGVAEERYLVVVDKVAATPPQYPRKPGFPAKKPL